MMEVRKSGILRTIPSLIAIFSLSFPAYAKYNGGSGTEYNPYQIATAEDLVLLGENSEDYDKYFSEYMVTLEEVSLAIKQRTLFSFAWVRDPGTGAEIYAYFWDFKKSIIMNGDPVFTFKGMSDRTCRESSFKYALRQAVLQDRLADTVDDKWAESVFDSSDYAFDSLQKLSKLTKNGVTAIQIVAKDRNLLRFYRDNIINKHKNTTLKATHGRLMNRLTQFHVLAATANLALNIGKDTYRALFIRSLDEELVDQRIKVLRATLETDSDVPREMIIWINQVEREIERERINLWLGIARELQEGSMGELILPLADLANSVAPFISAGWAKAAGKFALPIGIVIEVAENLVKIDDFGWMIGKTTSMATLAQLYLRDKSPVEPASASSTNQICPEIIQMRTYLLYFAYDLYAKAYEGNQIDHGVRFMIGSLQDLAGMVPSWTEERLQELRDQKTHFASLYIAAYSEKVANRPPLLASIGDKSVDENATLTFTINATDPNGEPITYSAQNLPSGATLDSQTGDFVWTPSYVQAGSYLVTFRANNGNSNDSETITITVYPQNMNPNNPSPVLQAIGNKSVDENVSLVFIINATDPNGEPITYSAQSLPSGATLDSQTGDFAWTPSYTQAGSYSVTFRASDGNSQVSETIIITVNNINRAPVLGTISDWSVDENTLLSFSVNATDPDGEALTYSVSGLPNGAVFASQTFTWIPAYDQAGTFALTFTADDGQAQDSQAITITVNNVNRAPVFTAINNKSVWSDDPLTFTIDATDPDGDAVTYSANAVPRGATFITETFDWTPTQAQIGSYNVTFYASDGQLQDSETITITVKNINKVPILGTISG